MTSDPKVWIAERCSPKNTFKRIFFHLPSFRPARDLFVCLFIYLFIFCFSQGSRILSIGIIQSVDSTHLSQLAVSNLFNFYADRMHDFPCLADLFPGIIHMISPDSAFAGFVTTDNVIAIITQIFSEVQTQSLSQNTRAMVYDILLLVLNNYTQS